MGRMLETFKLGEGRRVPLALSKPPDTAPVQDCVVDWEIGAEVPYVEVGGPGKKVELSPGLMKHAPQAAPQPPHLNVEPSTVVSKPSAVMLTEMKPMLAALEPWPTAGAVGISAEVVAYHQPDHAASKEYAKLLEAMRSNLKPDAGNVLLLIGLKPSVGTSTVLLNLGVIAAQQKRLRVALVDANVQRPGLAHRLGLATSVGLMEVIEGTIALEHALVKTGIDSLHLLAAGSPVKMQSPLTSEAMAWLISWLRDRYDLIFLDAPLTEAEIPPVDGVYLVLPQGESGSLHKGFAQTITRKGGHLRGLIHTHFDV